MSELAVIAVMIENELEAMRRAPRKPATQVPAEVSNGNVVAQLTKRALPDVIRDQKAHQKSIAENERRRKAEEAQSQASILAATPPARESGEVFSYEQSDPSFV